MITRERAMEFAKDWIDSWNSHNLDRILSHYTDDFEMSSPRITKVMNEPSGTLKGKKNVSRYWEKSLTQSPDLRFEFNEVLVGAESLVICYDNVARGKKAAEVFIFNPEGRVVSSIAHYD